MPRPSFVDAALEPLARRLFLRVAEIAQLTEADPRTIRRAIELGQIEAVRLGDNAIRIPAAPFWRLCGLDPETLRPLRHDDGVDLDPDDSEAGVTADAGFGSNVLALGARRDRSSSAPST